MLLILSFSFQYSVFAAKHSKAVEMGIELENRDKNIDRKKGRKGKGGRNKQYTPGAIDEEDVLFRSTTGDNTGPINYEELKEKLSGESRGRFSGASRSEKKYNTTEVYSTEANNIYSGILNPRHWFLKLSTTVNFFNLGPQIKSELNQAESLFAGNTIRMNTLGQDFEFTMESSKNISRAPTYFAPMGNLGFLYEMGNHHFEIELGITGMVPINTIDTETAMVMRETETSTAAGLYHLVDSTTKEGAYSLKVVMNERIWMISPSIYYSYQFFKRSWGSFSFGIGAGVMVATVTQTLNFSAVRTDLTTEKRIMTASVQSTAVNDVGPIGRCYFNYRGNLFGKTQFEIRIGGNFGFIYLHRDVNGSGSVNADGVTQLTFPVDAMTVDGKSFDSREKNRLDMYGFFIQAGVLF